MDEHGLARWLAVVSLAGASVVTSTASAADGETTERYFDLRLSPTVGYFVYPQKVDGGYYIDNNPYDLVWRGVQLHVLVEAQISIPGVSDLSAGLGGAFLYAPGPTAGDSSGAAHVDLHEPALGGYAGASGSYWLFGNLRFSLLAGYGGNGISDGNGFGGYGPVVSTGAQYVVRSGSLVGGIGIRLLAMFLSYGGTGTTRGESGTCFAAMLEPSGDWVPAF